MSFWPSLNRRRFLQAGTTAAAGVAGVALTGMQSADASQLRPGQFDQSYLDHKADVRQIWDFTTVEQLTTGLSAMKNAANAFQFSYNKSFFLVVDMRGSAVVGALNGTMWIKYKLGAKYQIFDPATTAYVMHNPFYQRLNKDAGTLSSDDARSLYQDATLAALALRGAHLSACHDALQSQAALTVKDGRAPGMTANAVYRDFAANLVPSAQETPSGSALIAVAQLLGYTYAKQ